ncbi:MAG: hypothetical protein ACRENI_01175, partial [Gemmatimonadaceae bacterium]
HVDVYYYAAEERIARLALSYAEQSYDVLAGQFNHHVKTRIPLIIYASHSDFEQTNVLPFVPPEGILGATEFMKRRVVMPFRGSYSEFRHTLRHELVHVFQLSLLERSAELYPRSRRVSLPLWWSEGLAEFLSSDQETRDRMVVRDLTLGGRLPSIVELNLTRSPIVYPVGGELHDFLADRYGAWRATLVYESLSRYDSFEETLRAVYGRTSQELSTEWAYAMRQRFFPEVADRKPLDVAGKRIVTLGLKPIAVVGPDSIVDVAYLSPRSGYTNIYRHPVDYPAEPQVEVRGERTPEFESLHPFSSRIDAQGDILLFASKYNDRDAIVFWDMVADRVVGRYQFDSIVGILSPALAPDGAHVAFSGLTTAGVSDLFLLDLRAGALSRITDDHYEDLDPTWLPGSDAVVFASDRAPGGDDGAKNLFRIPVRGGRIDPLTAGRWVDESPRWDPERGRIFFVSDRDGSFNLYSIDTLGHGARESRLDGGVFDPAPIPGDDRMLVGGFSGLTWSVFTLLPDPDARDETFAFADTAPRPEPWRWIELADSTVVAEKPSPYERRFSLDVAAGGSEMTPVGGTAQGAQLMLTDLLGDHAIFASLSAYQRGGFSDVLSNLNANVFYLNQSRRLNWGFGVFRLSGFFYESGFAQVYRETSGGVYGTLRYPLSRFTRVEGQTRLEFSNRQDFDASIVDGELQRRGLLASNYISLVGDNTLWIPTGPIDGRRWNITAGVVSDVTHGEFEDWLGSVDGRKYIRTSQQSAVALRGYLYLSEGSRPRAVQLGGAWLLRGYPFFAVDGTRAWLTSAEWRFPLANFVTLGLPIGAIRLPPLQGALYGDLGQAWYKGRYDERVLGSAGVGFRMPVLPGLVLRVDVGRRFSFRAPDEEDSSFYHRRYVDFFFGYNY